jgi:hypothetical protein
MIGVVKNIPLSVTVEQLKASAAFMLADCKTGDGLNRRASNEMSGVTSRPVVQLESCIKEHSSPVNFCCWLCHSGFHSDTG